MAWTPTAPAELDRPEEAAAEPVEEEEEEPAVEVTLEVATSVEFARERPPVPWGKLEVVVLGWGKKVEVVGATTATTGSAAPVVGSRSWVVVFVATDVGAEELDDDDDDDDTLVRVRDLVRVAVLVA